MISERPTFLGKRIQVRAENRPIKIAYLVPYENKSKNHEILDAVFFESYTRWGGAKTLLIPCDDKKFFKDEYKEWLQFYDPDLIYSFVELSQELMSNVNDLVSPIVFYTHEDEKKYRNDWRSFIPDWDHKMIDPISSKSTVFGFLRTQDFGLFNNVKKNQKIITQYELCEDERFLSDNFGTTFEVHKTSKPLEGEYSTLCFVPEDLSENVYTGSEQTSSVNKCFEEIVYKDAYPISKFSISNSSSIDQVRSMEWSRKFNLFVSSTCLDRINFWNSRLLAPDFLELPNSLIITSEKFSDDKFLELLGSFLNNFNKTSYNNNQHKVTLRSHLLQDHELSDLREKIEPHTYNIVKVGANYNSCAIPSSDEISKSYSNKSVDCYEYKLSEDKNTIEGKFPAHFEHIPREYRESLKGQWAIELEVQRHNNLSIYSNVVDTWKPPRRYGVTKAFTDNPAKVNKYHKLSLIPTTQDKIPLHGPKNRSYSYKLRLPEDESFFRNLILGLHRYPQDDSRQLIDRKSYENLAISDKGQNLRGVISMFGGIKNAYRCIANKFWRELFRDFNDFSSKELIFTKNKIESYLPKDIELKKILKDQHSFSNIGEVIKFYEKNLDDTLEYLIARNVFYRIYEWRCNYCGHNNIITFDKTREIASCAICDKEYITPIDLEWKFKLNDFVYRSLFERNGLTVLWALGFLQTSKARDSFYYMPEVDLYESWDGESKNEIDILCMVDGKFHAVEVKLSAYSFVNNGPEVEKFIQELKLIRPDKGILIFEQYSDNESDEQKTSEKLKNTVERISSEVFDITGVEAFIASEYRSFSDFPLNLGYEGKRVMEFYDSIHEDIS